MRQKSQQIKWNLPANQQPSTAAVAQPAQTGFTAPKQVTVEDVTKAVTTPAQAQTAPAAPAPVNNGMSAAELLDMNRMMTANGKSFVGTDGTIVEPQQLSYVDMLNKMYTPETAEEKAKRERKEKWDKTAAAIGDGISALANLYYTTKGAPNSYDGTKSMSERTRQLYDKLDKDRKENERWYLNHYMNAAKMDEEAKRYKDQIDYRDKQYAYKKEQDELNRKASEAKAKLEQDRWQAKFDADKAQKEFENDIATKKLGETVRHNKTSEAISRANAKKENYHTFYIGEDERIDVPKEAIHDANVSRIFNMLPNDVTRPLTEEPIYSKNSRKEGKIVGYKRRTPTLAEMWDLIGRESIKNSDVQDELRKMSGKKPKKQETKTSSAPASSGGGKHSYRVGGNNSVTDI